MDSAVADKDVFTFDDEAHIYRLGNRVLPSVTQVLRDAGVVEFYGSNNATHAMLRGTYAHLACELLDKNKLDRDTLDDEVRPYLEAYEAFKRDSGFVPELIEKRLYHPYAMYAGTIDRVGLLSNERALIDLKTGGKYRAYDIQLGGYDGLCSVNEHHIDKAFSLYLKANGKYSLVELKDRKRAAQVFMAALTLKQWKGAA
jgi:hypothetical protein